MGIMVADRTGLDPVRRFVLAADEDWKSATIHYGSREFVE